jgi:hypothetical protein
LWGLKLVQFLGPLLRKRIQNYKHKIRYKIEYLFRMRKDSTTIYKIITLTGTTYHIVQKNYMIFFINYLPGTPVWYFNDSV